MEWLIWAGALLTLCGVAGLGWCVVYALKARSAGLGDDELRARLQRAVAINLGALAVSALGLIMVVAGIFLT
ncbi:hypothetical protein [Alkalilacustris brevis]|uniref:hypothetical protein n=1 Tax=Alkalilacustris brevis TaxID=2026338 RepID=UPI000E0D9C9E|nr:hypothetical protein [Alkalilacustris brevis]